MPLQTDPYRRVESGQEMRNRIKRITINLTLVVASVTIVLVGTEVFLRLYPQYLPPAARLRVHWMEGGEIVGQADRYVGYRDPPHYHGRVSAGDVHFEYTTDGHGFRNPSPWPDTADIVVIGDSEAFGYGVPDDSTWSSLLKQSLPGVRLVNLALPGMAPRQYLRVYERYGVPLHPKLVLLGLFPGNDLSDEKEFDAWLDAGSPGNFATWKFNHNASPGLIRRALRHSYLFWFLVETAKSLQRRTRAVKRMTFADGTYLRFAPSFLEDQAKMANPDQPVFQDVMESIEKAQTIAAQHGTAFLVLVFPTKEDVYLPLRGQRAPQVLAPLVAGLKRRGVPYLDLTVPMQAVARHDKRLFFEIDGHPDEAGYRVIAHAVLANIRQNAGKYHLRVDQH